MANPYLFARADWWIEMEAKIQAYVDSNRGKDVPIEEIPQWLIEDLAERGMSLEDYHSRKTKCGTFRKDRPEYIKLKRMATGQRNLFDGIDELEDNLVDCFCTD